MFLCYYVMIEGCVDLEKTLLRAGCLCAENKLDEAQVVLKSYLFRLKTLGRLL